MDSVETEIVEMIFIFFTNYDIMVS